ncbi:MAG: GNAT family N-acetyltransferase [Opitutaceae bacterium]
MQIHHGFYRQEHLAQPFFELQRMIFPGLDLAWARDNGFLSPEVVPFGLFENGRALSILNATTSNIVIRDHTIRAVQLGTVATHPEFRKTGLSRLLINKVFDRYRDSTDIVFLYANDQVLDFYPKLGFERVLETHFSMPVRDYPANSFRRLDPKKPQDRETIFRSFDRRVSLSGACGVEDYRLLAKWYALTFFADNLWYHEDTDVLIVASIEDRSILVHDVVSSIPVPGFFRQFSWPAVEEAILQFVPDQFEGSFAPMSAPAGDTLFVRGRLPPGIPVKIPVLAHT